MTFSFARFFEMEVGEEITILAAEGAQDLTVVGLAVTAQVEADKCASCLICVRSCPYDVPKINADGVSEIDEALCHGCGICTAECPAKAIQLNWYEDDQILCKVEALLDDIRLDLKFNPELQRTAIYLNRRMVDDLIPRLEAAAKLGTLDHA